jgi:hypothetical protein
MGQSLFHVPHISILIKHINVVDGEEEIEIAEIYTNQKKSS